MKDLIYILMKNNTIIKQRIKNPSSNFKIIYSIDNEIKEFTYKYKREKAFLIKTLFGYKRISFYEHGKLEPLDCTFKTSNIDLKEISDILHTDLFKQLISSTKIKGSLGSIGMILGLAGILGLVIIVIFSKLVG